MKGFLFSIEALFTVAVIIAVISIFWSINSAPLSPQNPLMIQVQSNGATTQYFDLNATQETLTAQTQVCEKIIYYDYQAKAAAEKDVCGAIE